MRDLNFSNAQAAITAELATLTKLKTRFSRNTLNIGVVGRARQGKSRLLQTLSGLTATEIPDGDRQHCTGVRSTIYHNPEVEPYGEIFFHSRRTFLSEVIAPYYSSEKGLRLGSTPQDINEFAANSLPDLPKDLPGYAEPRAKYEHLTRYKTNIQNYRSLLDANSPLKIEPNQVREYVAQDTPNGQRVYFNYLAVKEVKIVCRFPHQDVGQIALVDMPGLGDTGIGDQERLVKALGEEIDVVMFVRMPKSSGDVWADYDISLYDLARSALTELPIDRWSFMVLNHTSNQSKNGDNYNNCLDLQNSITTTAKFDVVETIIADCANPEDVQSKVLDDILKMSMETVKQHVSTVFKQQGHFTGLSNAQGSFFLLELADRMHDDVDLIKLNEALQVLAAFQITYRGFVQHRIRKHIDRITPDLTDLRLSEKQSAQEVAIYLTNLKAETIYNLDAALRELLKGPNEAAFAIVEEFVDQILRSEAAESAWRYFYRSYRADIWPDEFLKWGQQSQLQKQWQAAVELANQSNRYECLHFLS